MEHPKRIAQRMATNLLIRIAGKDSPMYKGIVHVREVPFSTEREFLYWWSQERDSAGRVIREPRMSEKEKERYTVAVFENDILLTGIVATLTYWSSSASSSAPSFCQYFSVGTGGLAGITPLDNAVVGELFRKVPTTTLITGNQVDVSTYFAQTEGNGLYTNAGLYGNGASGSLGTGTLYTHTLYSYNKTSANPVTNDYVITCLQG